MKVLHVINSLEIGGAEKLIVDGFGFYLKNGVDIDLVVLKESDVSFHQFLPNNVTVTFLTKGSVYNPKLIFSLIKYIKRYNIIHAHLFPTLYWVVLAKLLSFCNSKIVYTEHNTYNRRRGNGLFKLLDRFIYKYISIIGCISEATKNNLIDHLGLKKESKKVVTVLNGIDLQKFELSKKGDFSYFSLDKFKLMQVSSFTKQKDQATLIRALSLLPEDIVLILVGDGALRCECLDLVNDLCLQGRVFFTGIRTDIPELINYSDVVILSSHFEGFGLAALEGMASIKPAIASNIPGVSEIIGDAGLLFKKGDENDLAAKILTVYSDQTYYKSIAQNCYKRAQEYSIDNMVRQYVDIYKRLIE